MDPAGKASGRAVGGGSAARCRYRRIFRLTSPCVNIPCVFACFLLKLPNASAFTSRRCMIPSGVQAMGSTGR